MVHLALIMAQALAAQDPSSGPVAAVAPPTDTVVASTPTVVASTPTVVVSTPPAPPPALRAPVLLRQEVAFASTEAVRIEWETDLSAVGEVRYGTAAPLAFSAKAPVYSPSQSVTIDSTGLPPGVPLYFQISWTDRLGLGGTSALLPIARRPPEADAVSSPSARAEHKPEERAPEWLVFAGPRFRGQDLGWNLGAAHRPASLPLEAALELGAFRHKDQDVVYNRSGSDFERVSKLSFHYLRARASYLYRIEHLRDPFGEALLRFPGSLRAGVGLAAYRARHTYEVTYRSNTQADVEMTETQTKLAPYLELAVTRRIGTRLELALSGEYALTTNGYGFRDYGFGGAAVLLQLAYRLK